ncbi:MAG: hypothetical protein KKA28_07100 [Planctomycetes bacterium]|nr:hypothetical protein [Planctomycetota bacterium]MCG2684660.1 hypothetical protein [Planctomycetales bacterium]
MPSHGFQCHHHGSTPPPLESCRSSCRRGGSQVLASVSVKIADLPGISAEMIEPRKPGPNF